MSREDALIGLSACPSFGPKKFQKFIEFFRTPQNIWQADLASCQEAGLTPQEAKKFFQEKKQVNLPLLKEILFKENIKTLSFSDLHYPPLLKKIPDPPFLLYYKGNLEISHPSFAIVGTRRMSPSGKAAAYSFAQQLSSFFTIVSGLALGIDTQAHRATLENNGQTIAVLASGLNKDHLYPQDNLKLAQKIIDQGGLLLSEYPPGVPGLPFYFPFRNRIISGLSQGALIIESGEKGGSLITAQYALQQNRPLFALPGDIYNSRAKGNLLLLQKKKARLVISPEDILKEFNFKRTAPPQPCLSPLQEKIISYLSEPLTINELKNKTGLPLNKLNMELTMMEMKSLVQSIDGIKYISLLDKK